MPTSNVDLARMIFDGADRAAVAITKFILDEKVELSTFPDKVREIILAHISLSTIQQETLEEAAKICDAKAVYANRSRYGKDDFMQGLLSELENVLRDTAANIRALKGDHRDRTSSVSGS